MVSGTNGISLNALQPGNRINSTYQVVRTLGKGGMGTVYEVTGLKDNQTYALKMLHPAFADIAEIATRFLREIRLGDKLKHKNIVRVLGNGTIEGVPYYAMEMLYGENLGERLEKVGVMTFDEAYPILDQVIDAVASAHAEGVVHRDLKPDNIFLCDDGSVKVLDFGIAKITEEADETDLNKNLTKTMAVLGTPRYMSPEQANGSSKDANHLADVFALGAIIYQMLSGEYAFPGDSSNEIIVNIALGRRQTGVLESKSNLPLGTIPFIDKALAVNRNNRFQSMLEMGAFLRVVKEGSYVDLEPAAKPARRSDSDDAGLGTLPGCESRILDSETALEVAGRERRRKAALWISIAFLALSGGLGAAYCFNEPHTRSVVDNIVRTVLGRND
jgi:serine/threonine-protein kinase